MSHITSPVRTAAAPPVVCRIDIRALGVALRRGWDDFSAHPSHAFFLTLIYPVIGIVLALVISGDDLFPLLYPLVTGFALVGPFAAVGLYEISRRRERGLEVSTGAAFDVLRSPAIGSVLVMGLLLVGIFLIWLGAAQIIYNNTLGQENPRSLQQLAELAFTTGAGWRLMVVGNLVGFLFAALVLTISVVSFPLLIDRNVGVSTAIETSIKAVSMNPLPMALWGLIVAVLLGLAAIPALIGLTIALPVLGHATWHLYRQVVRPAD